MKGGGEHRKDLEFRRVKSHLFRHCVDLHPTMNPDKVDFRMKILSTHKTAFERQIRESIVVDNFAGPQILNSKMEYTRCGIPKLESKMGNKQQDEDIEITRERDIIRKIEMLYKCSDLTRSVAKIKTFITTIISTSSRSSLSFSSSIAPECVSRVSRSEYFTKTMITFP